MTMSRRLPSAVLLTLLVAGCGGSDETHYYKLVPTVGAALPASAASCVGAPIAVAAVSLPDAVNRGEIVRADDDDVDVSNHDRWAAPLGTLMQRTLAQELQARLPAGRVLGPDAPAQAGAAMVRLVVKRFMADDNGVVTLNVSWSLVGAGGSGVVSRSEAISVAGGSSYEQIPASMSTAVGILSDRIAAVLAQCPG
jgi:uncharacterized protein